MKDAHSLAQGIRLGAFNVCWVKKPQGAPKARVLLGTSLGLCERSENKTTRLCISTGTATSAPTLGEGLANRDFNSEVLATHQFLEDSPVWAESVRIELLFVVSAWLGFVQNGKSYGGLSYQEEDCLEA